jgi:spermidine/putrescine transport system substrate-binding protein
MDISGYTPAIATPEIKEAQINTSLTETVNLSYFFGPGNDSLKVDPIQYPDSSVVERCVLEHDFLDKNDKVLEMWSRARGDNLDKRMILILVGIVLLLAAYPIYRQVKKYRNKQKKAGKK